MKECLQVAVGISDYTRRFRKAFVALREVLLSRISRVWRMKTGMNEEARRSDPPNNENVNRRDAMRLTQESGP